MIELIVVTAIFVVVLMITGISLKTILEKSNMTVRSEESNTEGVVGLEILRHDLEQAGLGLFSDATSIPTYTEAADTPYSSYNDVDPSGVPRVPRAIVTANDVNLSGVLAGTDYLAIKGTTLGRSVTSQSWTYVPDSGVPKIWGRDDFKDANDKLIVIEQTLDRNKGMVVRRLVQKTADNYGVGYSATGAFKDQGNIDSRDSYTPSTGKTFYLYGIDRMASSSFSFIAPFNRADFFINRDGNTPDSCSPAAGVLYEAVMQQKDGSFEKIPLLNCVADMQIVLGWNTSSEPEKSNEVLAYSNANGSLVSETVPGSTTGLNGVSLQDIQSNPDEVRRRLRLVMVYLLAQDGRRDNNFINSNTAMLVGDQNLNLGSTLTKTVDLTKGDFRNYRWKLYRIVVRPKNLF